MSHVNLSVEVWFHSDPHGADHQFEAFLEEVLTQFDKLGHEVNLAASLTERRADWAVILEAESFEDAVSNFLGDLRTALHAAGCATRGWPTFRPRDRVVRELQDA